MKSNTLRVVAMCLLFFGMMLTLASSVSVYNAWRVAIFSHRYRPATFEVVTMQGSADRDEDSASGTGVIDGVVEKIGFGDFGPWVSSRLERGSLYEPGALIDVYYDPSAADVMTQGSYLRVIPRTYDLESSMRIALLKTAKWNAATTIGLILLILKRSKKTQRA